MAGVDTCGVIDVAVAVAGVGFKNVFDEKGALGHSPTALHLNTRRRRFVYLF